MASPDDITRHHEWDARDGDDIWVPERPEPEPIVIAGHDPAWPEVYDHVLALDHVGSTAVPGLAAKPVIDVDLTVADSSDEASYAPDLQGIGLELTIREPGWHEHRLFKGADPRVNLHVFSPDCPETIRHLMFCDWLRAQPGDAEAYVDAKLAAAAVVTSNTPTTSYPRRGDRDLT